MQKTIIARHSTHAGRDKLATTGRRPFFLCAAADRAGSSSWTTDVDSLVRDKGRQAAKRYSGTCGARAVRGR